eukprot:6286539-Karenia_brevis.AAC.1
MGLSNHHHGRNHLPHHACLPIRQSPNSVLPDPADPHVTTVGPHFPVNQTFDHGSHSRYFLYLVQVGR